jgi:Flp pilus assembly protein TadG
MLGTLRSFLRSSRGNVAMIFAISLVPLIYLTGMGVDYGSAAMREAQLNAIADSAALSGVTPAIMQVMSQGDTPSVTAATNTFNAQAGTVQGVGSVQMKVTVADTITTRSVTVSFTAQSQNFFPNVLGSSNIALSGSSTAVGSVAPNIDFYLLLDDSPSMALPATSAGIAQMQQLTPQECDPNNPPSGSGICGCAFACHESNPAGETYCNKTSCSNKGTGNTNGEDNYALARANNITLRIDNLQTAVENLTTTAQQTMQAYDTNYRMAVYTFDSGFNKISSLTATLSTVNSDAQNIQVEEVYQNNELSSGSNNNDEDTNWDNAMNQMNTTMPAPGNGTNAAGDTPQEVLFIVTDGVVDESPPSGTAGQTTGTLSSAYGRISGGRQQSTVNPLNTGGSEYYKTDWCTTIKNRNIRIAILYTQYVPLASVNGGNGADGWYNSFDTGNTGTGIRQLQCTSQGSGYSCAAATDNVGAQLQACASPGLYEEVSTDGDISAALSALFQQAVVTAHLTK